MRTAIFVGLLLLGCAPRHYLFSFDLTDPGAQNFKDFRRPDVMEDADLKVEIRVDPTEFKAVALDITNKTEQSLFVQWEGIAIVGPDHEQRPLRPNAPVGEIEPGARVSAVLGPFELPAIGSAAKFYDETDFELVLPLTVRGAPRESRYHLHVKLTRI
jgi:hypothetical protein